MTIFDFWQKNLTVILSMLGVKFQEKKNATFLVCNKGIFFRKVEIQLHSSFKECFTEESTKNAKYDPSSTELTIT